MKPVVNYVDETAAVGHGTKIWHFAVVLAQVQIGDDCSIGSCSEIGRGTHIGSGCRIGHAVFLPPNSRLGKNVFIGPGAKFCDDKFPRVGNVGYEARPPIIEDGASVGAGVTVLPGIRIGAGALIGAGATVTRDVEPGAIVRGEPARAFGSLSVA